MVQKPQAAANDASSRVAEPGRFRMTGWDGRVAVTEATGSKVKVGGKTYELLGLDENGSKVYQDAEVLREQAEANADQGESTLDSNEQNVEEGQSQTEDKKSDVEAEMPTKVNQEDVEKFLNDGKIDTDKNGVRFNGTFPKEKLTKYSLDPTKCPDKAEAFKKALGYDLNNYADLMLNIKDNIDISKFVEKGDIGHGMRYEYIMKLKGPNGKTANVLTAWIRDGDGLRLTSVYVTEKEATK